MKILWQRQLLDHGFVKVIQTMGDDESVYRWARISRGHDPTEDIDASKVPERLAQMVRDGHTSPFEFAEIALYIKCPIYVHRQWIRHRTASVNERSMRYCSPEEFQKAGGWRGCDLDGEMELFTDEALLHRHMRKTYGLRRQAGVLKEFARKDLPLSSYTCMGWKSDLHNLLHFLELRTSPHAQEEIRLYADTILEFVAKWVPLTFDAWREHRQKAFTLSCSERFELAQAFDGLKNGCQLKTEFIEKWFRKLLPVER